MSGTESEKLTGQRKGLKSQLRLRGTEKEIDHEGPRKGRSKRLLLQLQLPGTKRELEMPRKGQSKRLEGQSKKLKSQLRLRGTENWKGRERARTNLISIFPARYRKRTWKAMKRPEKKARVAASSAGYRKILKGQERASLSESVESQLRRRTARDWNSENWKGQETARAKGCSCSFDCEVLKEIWKDQERTREKGCSCSVVCKVVRSGPLWKE